MLVAAGVLFYVSYWLVSQAETKRWMDFLKKQARRGLEWGGRGTLAVTAFLAVYREGAETSLMYQALIGSQGQTRPGVLGLASGFVVGLAILVGPRGSGPGDQRSTALAYVLQVHGAIPLRPGGRLRRQRRLRAPECRHPDHDASRLDGQWPPRGGTLSQSPGPLGARAPGAGCPRGMGRDSSGFSGGCVIRIAAFDAPGTACSRSLCRQIAIHHSLRPEREPRSCLNAGSVRSSSS